MKKITFISDLHSKFNRITSRLPGGDLIICAGDLTSAGHKHEIESFCKWFSSLPYKYKVFIAGNHDKGFEDYPEQCIEVVNQYDITYLQDSFTIIEGVKIYGTPWTPEFRNWAFNLPRNGVVMQGKWDLIPVDTDILITHGPVFGILDKKLGEPETIGCETLLDRINIVKPKIHVCGHIHSGYGFVDTGDIYHFNASVLDDHHVFNHEIMSIEWDKETNEIVFI